jgi:hypothetical protein
MLNICCCNLQKFHLVSLSFHADWIHGSTILQCCPVEANFDLLVRGWGCSICTSVQGDWVILAGNYFPRLTQNTLYKDLV